MIISRTPFRISFFGGGTDYPVWYKQNGGAVLSTTIDKYCHIRARYLPPFFDYKNRIVWSTIETVKDIDDIQHPAARECLKFLDVQNGVELHHDGDLPARTGLGSSSSFTVGCLHVLYALKGIMPSKMQLANEAIHIERRVLKENVGSQDQVAVAFGGFNRIEFRAEGDPHITPIVLNRDTLEQLQNHLMLIYTGVSRTASDIAGEQIKKTPERKDVLNEMYAMVNEAIEVLTSGKVREFGELMHKNWEFKRSITDKISTSYIDTIYENARKAGAIGGKLLGAGGGGFFLVFAEPDVQQKVIQALDGFLFVPFKFENRGTHIVYYEPNG